jgi:hypothetical protein
MAVQHTVQHGYLEVRESPLFDGGSAQSVVSIIGATENRRDRLCRDFSVLSVTSLILFKADVVPFPTHFDPFCRPWYDGVVLLQLSVVPQIADRTDSVRKYDKYDKNQIGVKMGTLKRIPIILKHSLHA